MQYAATFTKLVDCVISGAVHDTPDAMAVTPAHCADPIVTVAVASTYDPKTCSVPPAVGAFVIEVMDNGAVHVTNDPQVVDSDPQ